MPNGGRGLSLILLASGVLAAAGCSQGGAVHIPSGGEASCLDTVSRRSGHPDASVHVDGPKRVGSTDVYVLAVSGDTGRTWTCTVDASGKVSVAAKP